MDWINDTRRRNGRGNRILFTRDSPCLAGLSSLLLDADRRAIVLWALDLADESASVLRTRYTDETRPGDAVSAARDWSAGRIRMPEARRKILACHAAAGDVVDEADIAAFHAVGQACGTVHTTGHAIGYPIYDLTSIVRRCGIDRCVDAVEARVIEYESRLLHWIHHADGYGGTWAPFMLK